MAAPEYIAAAERTPRKPVCYMQIETADSTVLYYTTQSQWAGSDTLTNVSFDGTQAEAGDIIHAYEENEHFIKLYSGVVNYAGEQIVSLPYNSYLRQMSGYFLWTASAGASVSVRVVVCNGDPNTPANILYTGPEQTISGAAVGLSYISGLETVDTRHATELISAAELFMYFEYFDNSLSAWVVGVFTLPAGQTYRGGAFLVKPTGQVITSAIGFDSVLTSGPVATLDDVTESGGTIAYSYTYSTDDITYTPGGSFVDGDTLTASKFYKIQGDFTTATGGRGKIREIQLSEGIFRYYGTHVDQPFSGILPYIKENSVSTLNQKIQINKGLSTVGESSVQLLWTDDVSDLIASGYLKGKDVAIYSGFVGLATEAFEPILTGTWYDHDLDEVNRVVTVKIRDAFKQFEKREIPQEVVDPVDGSIDTATLTYTTESLITVMLDIFDQIGLRDRYISPEFAVLESGDYAATKYNVSRTMLKPEDAAKLLDQLAITGSLYLIPLGDGKIKPKPFDINQEHTAELDALEINFTNLKGNIKEFFSRFYAYYNPKTTLTDDPSKTDDYDNGTAVIDASAELKWFPEKGVKNHLDLWKTGRTAAATPLTVPPQALTDLMTLWNALFTEPLYTVTAKDVPPRYIGIEPADVVQINNLNLPVVNNAWQGGPSYTGKNISTGSSIPTGIFFNSDRSKMYTMRDDTEVRIEQFSLSTAGDVNTATYDSIFLDVSGQDSNPEGLSFSPDGTKMYMLGTQGRSIYQYTLSTPEDLSTATYDSVSFSVSAEMLASGRALFVTKDGSKFYVLGTNTGIFQYAMTTPFDLTTASYSSLTFDLVGEMAQANGLRISDDGRTMFIAGISGILHQYSIGTAFNISSAVATGDTFSVASEDGTLADLHVSDDGLTVYTIGDATNAVYQYAMFTTWELAGTTYDEGDRVISDGRMWRSRVGSNTGNNPASEAAFWQDMEITDAGLTDGKHFFVLGRKLNPNTALIELDLMEMPPGTIGAYSSAFSTAFDV